MKRLIILTIVASAFLFVIGLNISVNQNLQNKDVSLALKNIEALASGENPIPPYACNEGCAYSPGDVCTFCWNCVTQFWYKGIGSTGACW